MYHLRPIYHERSGFRTGKDALQNVCLGYCNTPISIVYPFKAAWVSLKGALFCGLGESLHVNSISILKAHIKATRSECRYYNCKTLQYLKHRFHNLVLAKKLVVCNVVFGGVKGTA